jgi:acyl-CoA dehydrogenase
MDDSESETDDLSRLLTDAATRLFESQIPAADLRSGMAGDWLADGWKAISDAGLQLALVDGAHGGYGIPVLGALELIRLAGRYSLPLPLPETMLAEAVLADARLPPAGAPASIAAGPFELAREDKGWRLRGVVERVPWGRYAEILCLETPHDIIRLEQGNWMLEMAGENLAGHPRDTLSFDVVVPPGAVAPRTGGPGLFASGAALRAIQIAGALERILELTISHVSDRRQFGRPLAAFQAVQQQLAEAAGHVAAAAAAASLAADALARKDPDPLSIAVAKARAGDAASRVCAIAHQLHGAIGFTEEHALHPLSRCASAWRDEFGRQGHWAGIVADAAFGAGANGLWPMVTRIGSPL